MEIFACPSCGDSNSVPGVVVAPECQWAQLTRERRLAECGWRAKGRLDDELELPGREHPMHDPALGG